MICPRIYQYLFLDQNYLTISQLYLKSEVLAYKENDVMLLLQVFFVYRLFLQITNH